MTDTPEVRCAVCGEPITKRLYRSVRSYIPTPLWRHPGINAGHEAVHPDDVAV